MGKEVEERRSARNCGAEGVKDSKTMKVVKEVKGCTGYVGGGGVCGIMEDMHGVGKWRRWWRSMWHRGGHAWGR